MKKIYITIFFSLIACLGYAQKSECSGFMSDASHYRYTASGYQEVVNGNHSKAINESRKIASIVAESELAKMVSAAVANVMVSMTLEIEDAFNDKYVDTALVSTYKVFSGMKTICQSETKLVDNAYVTYVTKEISKDNISDMLNFNSEEDKVEFKKLLVKE